MALPKLYIWDIGQERGLPENGEVGYDVNVRAIGENATIYCRLDSPFHRAMHTNLYKDMLRFYSQREVRDTLRVNVDHLEVDQLVVASVQRMYQQHGDESRNFCIQRAKILAINRASKVVTVEGLDDYIPPTPIKVTQLLCIRNEFVQNIPCTIVKGKLGMLNVFDGSKIVHRALEVTPIPAPLYGVMYIQETKYVVPRSGEEINHVCVRKIGADYAAGKIFDIETHVLESLDRALSPLLGALADHGPWYEFPISSITGCAKDGTIWLNIQSPEIELMLKKLHLMMKADMEKIVYIRNCQGLCMKWIQFQHGTAPRKRDERSLGGISPENLGYTNERAKPKLNCPPLYMVTRNLDNPDNHWQVELTRARILETFEEDDTLLVRHIDYGHTEIVSIKDVYPLDPFIPILTYIPPLAVEVKLEFVDSLNATVKEIRNICTETTGEIWLTKGWKIGKTPIARVLLSNPEDGNSLPMNPKNFAISDATLSGRLIKEGLAKKSPEGLQDADEDVVDSSTKDYLYCEPCEVDLL